MWEKAWLPQVWGPKQGGPKWAAGLTLWGCPMRRKDLQFPPPPCLLNLLTSLSPPLSGGLGPVEGGPWLRRLFWGPGLSKEKCRKPPSLRCLADSCSGFKTHPGHGCVMAAPGLSPSSLLPTLVRPPRQCLLFYHAVACLFSGGDCALSASKDYIYFYVPRT